jgi:hypothetical protein
MRFLAVFLQQSKYLSIFADDLIKSFEKNESNQHFHPSQSTRTNCIYGDYHK